MRKLCLTFGFISFVSVFCFAAAERQIDTEAYAILQKDKLKPPAKFEMPNGCVSVDAKSIENGRILFNYLSNDSGKFGPDTKKQFGNCIACHEIEKGDGYGNIGPSLKDYNKNYIKSGARTHAWVYQKIADPRIDNPDSVMTVNLTTKLLSEREICDIVSYLVVDKK